SNFGSRAGRPEAGRARALGARRAGPPVPMEFCTRASWIAAYEGPRIKRLRQKYPQDQVVTPRSEAQGAPPPPEPTPPRAAHAGAPGALPARGGAGCRELEAALRKLRLLGGGAARAAAAAPARTPRPAAAAGEAPGGGGAALALECTTEASVRREWRWDSQRHVALTRSTEVVKAVHRPTGLQYAVKKVNRQAFEAAQRRKSSSVTLENEACILERLRHPNIVQMYWAFVTEERLYIVMEDLPTDMYRSLDSGGQFPEPLAQRLFKEVCEAVAYAHECNVIHRDIKPDNVLLTSEDRRDMRAKLADFGISRVAVGPRECETYCGTRSYVAPEVVRQMVRRMLACAIVEGQDAEKCLAAGDALGAPLGDASGGYGKPSDVWGLGVLLYVMLTRKPPFDAEKDACELHRDILMGRWQFDVPEWKYVSSSAKELVRELLTVDPEARPSVQGALASPWLLGAGGGA
ncbi:unnamed protein product, partial [Prorocentrum cordatum]